MRNRSIARRTFFRHSVAGVAFGAAAGAAAALAAHRNTTLLNLPVQEIRELLKKHGAIVPED